MTAQQIAEQIKENIIPKLQELGVEAAVITGYRTDGDGKVTKITVGFDGNNPAYADGLRPMIQAAGIWAAGGL